LSPIKKLKKHVTSKSWSDQRKSKLNQFVIQKKSGLCVDCSKSFIPAAMHFDHRPGEIKIRHIRGLIDRAVSFEIIQTEIAKCDLVCVGCHRIRTASRMVRSDRYSCKDHDGFSFGCRMCGIADRRRIRSASLRELCHNMKFDKPCCDCGNFFIPLLMDWDHRPGETKVFDISSAVSGGWSLNRINAEITKCDLVCCWCHVIRTVFRRDKGVLSKTG